MAKSLLLVLFIFLQILRTAFNPTLAHNESKLPTNHNGLTIKLIHRDSPDSPLYQPNLTKKQRTKNLILQTISRSMQFHSGDENNTSQQYYNTTALRSRVEQQGTIYMAQVGIGTVTTSRFSPMYYFLHIDTASSLIWTQCEGCRSSGHHCFYQRQLIFPDSRSRSYRRLPCNQHPLCYPNVCLNGFCAYSQRYIDGAMTEGFLASETFAFDTTTVRNIVFGCGFNQLNMRYGQQGRVAGLIGLGWDPRSLLSQLGPRGQSRFSYCLQRPSDETAEPTLLRFGSDIPSGPGLRSTDLVRVDFSDAYFVNLVDISIAGTRLRIPAIYFSRRPQGRSGVAMDSGSTYTTLVEPACELFERAMERLLVSAIPGLRRIHVSTFMRLCFERPNSGEKRGFRDLPSVTLHFSDNADIGVMPEEVFMVGGNLREHFCLLVVSAPYDWRAGGVSLIGAFQQRNQRLICDVGRRKLQFASENCAPVR